jgi:hypothetical protein
MAPKDLLEAARLSWSCKAANLIASYTRESAIMIHLIESVLNGVVLFIGPLMLVGAIGSGLAMLQRCHDSFLGQNHRPELRKRPLGPSLQRL